MREDPIDFLAPRRPTRAGLVLLVSGLLSLSVSVAVVLQRSAEHEAAVRATEDDQHRLAAQARQRVRMASPPSPRELAARAERRRPWLPVLQQIESVTRPPLYLTTITVEAGSGAVRVEGEAPDYASAVRYVASLEASGVLLPAQLLSHESADLPSAGPVVRFAAQSHWVAR